MCTCELQVARSHLKKRSLSLSTYSMFLACKNKGQGTYKRWLGWKLLFSQEWQVVRNYSCMRKLKNMLYFAKIRANSGSCEQSSLKSLPYLCAVFIQSHYVHPRFSYFLITTEVMQTKSLNKQSCC